MEIRAGDRVEIGHVMLLASAEEPSQAVRFNEGTVISTSIRLRADQLLDRTAREKTATGTLVHLLAEVGQMLVMPRPLRETCEQVLEFVSRAVAGSRHVLLLRNEAGELVQMAARQRGGRSDEPLTLSRKILSTVLEECTSVIIADTTLDPRFQGNQSIVAQAVRSAMAVPLFDNTKVLGLIYVDSQELIAKFNAEQLEILTLLGNMAAVKITNARLLETEQERLRIAQELATAVQIQRGLLPKPPHLDGWEIEAYLETCYEVGGDLYDFRMLPNGRLLFLLGDVAGKGMGASLLMSSFLSAGRVLYQSAVDPGEISRRLGSAMAAAESGRFVTGFLGCLDPATGSLQYVNAGHPAACLVSDRGVRELESNGIPFGILADFDYQTAEAKIEPDELFAVFSDGIPEAQRGEEMFDDDRVRASLTGARSLPTLIEARRKVYEDVAAFVGDYPRSDDITLILMRRRQPGLGDSAPSHA
jgi:serine phosphatase RsbU (regulator of sigma subunit)